MKKGFTLLELIIVIIILGVLATLGLTQYTRMIEKSRGAEARAALGDLRKMAMAYRLDRQTVTGIGNTDLGIGSGAQGNIPGPAAANCYTSHYFFYSANCNDPSCTFTATRCIANGKTPQGATAGTLTLQIDYTTGVDTWGGNGGY